MKNILLSVTVFILAFFTVSPFLIHEAGNNGEIIKPRYPNIFHIPAPEKEILYTLKPSYFELDISSQTGYFHTKDSTISFAISTGNEKIYKAVPTKEGLFVIQSKLPKLYSIQFDSTLMLNWLGFNFGIGFHALLGNGYYNYLGKKPSSHGCVRISKADAKFLYDNVTLGTPVLVHSGESNLQISFGDSTGNYLYLNSAQLKNEVRNRFSKRARLLFDDSAEKKLLIDRGNVNHSGIPIQRKLIYL
jgi:hypothetical protein